MIIFIWLSLAISFVLLILFPFVFSEVMVVSLAKLHLDPRVAVWIIIAILLGGLVNIPITRIAYKERIFIDPFAAYGLFAGWPEIRSIRRETIVAVNVGGCLIPASLALYELYHLSVVAPSMLWAAGIASFIATGICHLLARPVAGVGVVIPGLIPALVASLSAVVLAPEAAPPIAFIAGVAGPLIGADLLNLKDMSRLGSGMVTIGGAGTFDGIVLSSILAAYLA